MSINLQSKIEGLLLGAAVGDAIGLPAEGMTPAKIKMLDWTDPLRHRFLFRRGMWSDDTEQTIMIAQSLLSSQGDLKNFTRSFAWELRWWILGMPAATGLATARAIIKLWLGFPPSKSGVFSAGNGSAMRTTPIAAYFPNDREKRKLFSEAQTRITHSDPKAVIATLAVTELAALFLNCDTPPSRKEIFDTLSLVSADPEWTEILSTLDSSSNIQDLLTQLKGNPGKGISGYVYQTVPAVILTGLNNDWDFESTVTELIAAGGDTDTTAAIAGALCGGYGGIESIPKDWIANLREWPTRVSDLSSLSRSLCHHTPHRIRARWSPALLARNFAFLFIVLAHGFLRPFWRPIAKPS